jgi:hypothetical protein
MVYVESSEDTRLVRFGSDDLAQNEIAHELYSPSFTLIEVPFTPEGEAF